MDSLLHFFHEFPGTIAPKIQMMFGVLHLARDELLWYFRHYDFQHKGKKMILKPDTRVTDLLYFTYRLDDLVKTHRKLIQTYYLEYLTGQDMKMLEPVIKKFFEECKVEQGMKEKIYAITEAIKDRGIGDNFESIRLNWYRISAFLASANSGIKVQDSAQTSQAMTRIIIHTRNVDCVEAQLRTHGSFKHLYWYKNTLQVMLKECLSGQGNARNAICIVQCLGHALDNVHRVCPEEQTVVGKESVRLADSFLKTIVVGVEQLLASVSKQIGLLKAKVGFEGVLSRLGPETRSLPLPGDESRQNDPETAKLRAWKRALGQICASVQEVEKITVYNVEFCPREYIYEAMSKLLRSSLRSCCLIQGKEGKVIQRPSVALERFKDVIYAFQNMESNISIDVSTMIREVLLSEFSDLRCGMVGTSLYKEVVRMDEKETKTTMIHLYAQWFKSVFKQFISEQYATVYSPVRRAFIGLKVQRGGQEIALLDAELKTDVNELRALARLVGPYGVRVIEKELLQIVVANVGTIREILARVKVALEPLRNNFHQKEVWLNAKKKITEVDLDTVLNRATIIGCVLVFRELLRNALRESTETAVPFVYSTVKLAFDHAHDAEKISSPTMAQLDLLAADCGFDVGENDHTLNESLVKYKSSGLDAGLWAYLPELFGLTLSCAKWKTAKYTIDYEGFLNNAHTVVWCYRSLIAAFNCIPLEPTDGATINLAIQRDNENFVRCAAYSLLHAGRAPGGLPQTQEAMVFLEQYILHSRGRLQLSILEEIFPFTLLRTNFIRIYEQQTKKGRRYAIDDDEKEST